MSKKYFTVEFKGKIWYLNVKLPSQFWFSKKPTSDTASELPKGYKIVKKKDSNFPYVKKS